MPDPYAYIPFNMSKLNKRKKAKLQGEYKGVVKAVKRGAQKAKNKKTNR
jgi:ribosomal RNA-processing protein 12